jgi:hypothetical protein
VLNGLYPVTKCSLSLPTSFCALPLFILFFFASIFDKSSHSSVGGMSATRLSEAFDQLQQLYALRELHQTLIARLQYYQQQHDVQMARQRELLTEIEMPNEARFIFTVGGPQQLHFPRSLEDMMLMRAIQMSLETVQPSSAPPPIAKDDALALNRVLVTTRFLQKLPAECEDCVICQESFRSMVGKEILRLPCDHFFCEACVTEWLRTSRTCPVCRTELVNVEKMYADCKKSRLLPVTPPSTSLPPVRQRSAGLQTRVDEPQGLALDAVRVQGDIQEDEEEVRRQQQQAELLEEIMTNRDNRQQATVGPRPPAAPSRSSGPTLSVLRRPPNANNASHSHQQPAPRRTAQLTVGRPRVSVPNTGTIRTGSVGVRGVLNSRRSS